MTQSTEQAAVDAAITSRRSIRAFLPKPVAREEVEALLQVADVHLQVLILSHGKCVY